MNIKLVKSLLFKKKKKKNGYKQVINFNIINSLIFLLKSYSLIKINK